MTGWIVRIAFATVAAFALLWTLVRLTRSAQYSQRLASGPRRAAARRHGLRVAMTISALYSLAVVLVAGSVFPAPLHLGAFALVFWLVGTTGMYVWFSLLDTRTDWVQHIGLRNATAFGVGAVACRGCGRPSRAITYAELDTGDTIEWTCNSCCTVNTIAAFDFIDSGFPARSDSAPHA